MRDNAGEFLVNLEAREKERTGLSSLRVEYNRVSGYYIEVPRAAAERVPADYRRRQTLKNVERFITPELKAFEDKALSAKERSLAREKELWDALSIASRSLSNRFWTPQRPLRAPMLFFPLPSMPKLLTG